MPQYKERKKSLSELVEQQRYNPCRGCSLKDIPHECDNCVYSERIVNDEYVDEE